MLTIELVCVALLALSAMLRWRVPGSREWLADAPIVALGALIGEDSCIRLYGFYSYAEGWHAVLDVTPALIPLIWIFVVLSARDVARELGPKNPLAWAFAIILFDAALIEPIATSSGLWHWTQPGPFAVPYIGIVGWAFYGVSILFWLGKLQKRWRWLAVVLAPLTTHALLISTWWLFFRWIGRDAPTPTVLIAAAWVAAVSMAIALVLTKKAGTVPLGILVPRICPAIFFAVLLETRHACPALWAYAASFPIPWLMATAFPLGASLAPSRVRR